MSIDYGVSVGYGIIINDENLTKLEEVLGGENLFQEEIIAELLDRVDVSVSDKTYGYEIDMWSGSGEAGAWIARTDSALSDDPRYLTPGVRLIPGVAGLDDDMQRLADWLRENGIAYEVGYFLGVSVR